MEPHKLHTHIVTFAQYESYERIKHSRNVFPFFCFIHSNIDWVWILAYRLLGVERSHHTIDITWRISTENFLLTCLNLAMASDVMKSPFCSLVKKHITWYWLWPRSSSPSTSAFNTWTSCIVDKKERKERQKCIKDDTMMMIMFAQDGSEENWGKRGKKIRTLCGSWEVKGKLLLIKFKMVVNMLENSPWRERTRIRNNPASKTLLIVDKNFLPELSYFFFTERRRPSPLRA